MTLYIMVKFLSFIVKNHINGGKVFIIKITTMKTETIPAKEGHKAIKFRKGGLHESTNTPMGEKIPAAKREAALHGKYGAKAEKQALFAKNVLTGGK